MIKKINIAKGQSIELSSSLGWLLIYREQFGHDILPDIMPIIESGLTTAVKVMQSSDEGAKEVDILKNINDEILTDVFISLSGLQLTTVLNIIWAMAKKANTDIKDPESFYDEYEMIPFDTVLPVIVKMLVNSMVSSKNARRLLTMMQSLNQSVSKKSSSQALTEV